MMPTDAPKTTKTRTPRPASRGNKSGEGGVHRSGFVALVGRPNVGKSSVMNKLLQQKVAITSPVMQTTRHRIRGIVSVKNAQLILLDTPGFSKPIDALGEYLVDEGHAALNEADAFGVVMDITCEAGPGDGWVVQQVQAAAAGKPVILILNKIDRLRSNLELQQLRKKQYEALFGNQPPRRIVSISAKTGKHIQNLEEALLSLLPVGPRYYDEATVTDQRMREMSAELIREQVLHLTNEEIPHSVAIAMDVFDESDPKLTRIAATLYVNQTSQKGILIGKEGSMIRDIGTQARKAIEKLVETKVFLELNVKLKKQWRKDDTFLKSIGLAPPSTT